MICRGRRPVLAVIYMKVRLLDGRLDLVVIAICRRVVHGMNCGSAGHHSSRCLSRILFGLLFP